MSNCIYVARLYNYPDETWTAVKLGQSVPKARHNSQHGEVKKTNHEL
jgi:hypothetical protein